MLVVAIIAIVSAVTLPSFMNSIRGKRLQTATRTVVMAGRYARSMAVMSQQEYALCFDLDESRITVGLAQQRPPVAHSDASMEPEPSIFHDPPGSVSNAPAVSDAAAGEIERVLDRIRITSVDVEEEGRAPADSGKVTVYYRTSGRCAPYTVKVADEDGKTATIEVDALASAETKE
jgi:type II secretory pathway pseudopilin PulG